MSITKKLLLTLALSTFAAGSQAVEMTLQSLFDGGEIQVGDKLFSDWQWYSENDIIRDFVNPSNILVSGDAADALNPALIFNMGQGLSPVSPNGPEYVNLDFGYRVDVLDPTMQLKSMTSDLLDADSNGGMGGIDITSFVQDENFFDIGLTNIFNTRPGGNQNSDSASFDNRDLIYVDTYVELFSQGGDFSLSAFEQRFMQERTQVPVAPTLLLFGLGLLGLGFTHRKK